MGDHRRKAGDELVAGRIVLRRQDFFGIVTLGRSGCRFGFSFSGESIIVQLLERDRKREIGGRDRLRCREGLVSRGRKYPMFGLPARQVGLRIPWCLLEGEFSNGRTRLPTRIGGCSFFDPLRHPAGGPLALRRQCGLLGEGQRNRLNRTAHRCQRIGSGKKFRRLGPFGMPNDFAARAADPPLGLQACNIGVVRCSAVPANDEHGRLRSDIGQA